MQIVWPSLVKISLSFRLLFLLFISFRYNINTQHNAYCWKSHNSGPHFCSVVLLPNANRIVIFVHCFRLVFFVSVFFSLVLLSNAQKYMADDTQKAANSKWNRNERPANRKTLLMRINVVASVPGRRM